MSKPSFWNPRPLQKILVKWSYHSLLKSFPKVTHGLSCYPDQAKSSSHKWHLFPSSSSKFYPFRPSKLKSSFYILSSECLKVSPWSLNTYSFFNSFSPHTAGKPIVILPSAFWKYSRLHPPKVSTNSTQSSGWRLTKAQCDAFLSI